MAARSRRPGRSTVLVAVALLGAAACGGDGGDQGSDRSSRSSSTTTATSGARVPIVVDTDLAADDLVALAFLLSSTEAEVRAVTVSGTGEVRCPKGLEVIRGLLAVTGDEDVPVACGRSTPLAGDHAFPTDWRDQADDAWGLDLPPVEGPGTDRTAVDLLTEVVDPGGVTLLTLGPLTNVADAFRADGALAGKVSSIVVMGGALDVEGNVLTDGAGPSRAEWNVYVDPTAAAEVVASGAPVVLVGLDATNQVPISGDFLERLRVNAHTDEARLAETILRNNPLVYTGDAYFWDPLAAAVAVDPALVSTEEATLAVVTDEGPDSGRTVRRESGDRATVAVDVDAAAFEELLIRTLDGLRPDAPVVAPPRPVADVVIRYDGTSCRYEGPAEVEAGRIRVSFESTEEGWNGAIAGLTGEVALDDVVAWIEAHPGETVPGLAPSPTVAPAGGTGYGDLVVGEAFVACASDAGEVVVAGGLTVG